MVESKVIMDILCERIPLYEALALLKLYAIDFKDKDVVEWATRELNGYENNQDLPDYRIVKSANFKYDGVNGNLMVNNASLPLSMLSDEVLNEVSRIEIRDSIKTIIEFSRENRAVSRDCTSLMDFKSTMRRSFFFKISCTSIRQEIPQTIYIGICQNVKSKIIDILTEMEKKHGKLSDLEGSNTMDKKKVFVVHGRDTKMRDDVELFLHRAGITPIILANEPSRGRTIIEKLEDYSDVSFAIILYTACDEGRLKGESAFNDRARQNVVFEHGYFCAKLSRANVVALYEPGVEIPSDLNGISYISLDSDWKAELRKEMIATGIEVK